MINRNKVSGTYETQRVAAEVDSLLRDGVQLRKTRGNERLVGSKSLAREILEAIVAKAKTLDVSERTIADDVDITPGYLREMRIGTREVPAWLGFRLPDEWREVWVLHYTRSMSRESRARIVRALEADDVAPLLQRVSA